MDHDFEDVEIKINAEKLLKQKLRTKYKKCMIWYRRDERSIYSIVESLKNIRTCLEIIEEYSF
jgi:uncharacterized membrane protein